MNRKRVKQEESMKRRKLVQASTAQINEHLLDLEKMFKEGKDRNDAEVKATEDKIRTALDIPRESWINTGQSLKDVIENLHKKLDIVQSVTSPQEMSPDKLVLKNASGGLALEGVYKTGNPEDLLKKREQLIEVQDSFSFTSPAQNTTFEQREFSSRKSEKTFHKVMERMGHSFSSSFQIGFKGFSFGFGNEKNESNEKEETSSNSQESYFLQTKYNYIPLACGVLQRDDFRLSSAAKKALKKIELISLAENYKAQIGLLRHFFERFGSHANQGPLHFGGIFEWRASASGFSSNDLSEVKKLTSESVNMYCGCGFGFGPLSVSGKVATSSSQLKGSLSGKYREDLMSQVHLSVSKTGGPPDIDDYLVWKTYLVANNRTWCVIDRGTTLIPVWEILTASHRDDFKDVSKLSTMLLDGYSEITGEHVEQMWGKNILSQVEKAEALMDSMETWSATDCESNLTHLLDFKTRLFDETGSHKIWHRKCLSNEILQNYLFKVVTANSESSAVNMRFLMRSLLDPDLYKMQHFQNRKQIMNWAYQTQEDSNEHAPVTDFSELERILQCAKKVVEESRHACSSSEQEDKAKMKATNDVTLSLNSFCKILENNNTDEKLLIISIISVIGYSRENKTFSHLLGINEIEFLQSELQKAFSKYSSLREECPIRAQAYLLLTALTVSTDKDKAIPPAEKNERLQRIRTELKDKLVNPIELVLEEVENDLESLEEALNSITLGGQEDKRRKFMNLLQKLGLKDSFPKQMTKSSVHVIDKLSQNVEKPKSEKDLSSHYLYKLMTLDYRARYLYVKSEDTDMVFGQEETVNDADDGDDFFDCDDKPDMEVSRKHEHIHPMDVHMAIFHCSSDFLRQFIFTKLSACQFSLPFLVPNPCTDEVEFPLWALRHIRKAWHSKTSDRYHNLPMFSTPVPIVSFLRLGVSDTNSKSQILNDVITKQKHPVFFNRHCKGSTLNSLLMDGVVEIAWYCPGGKEDDVFDDCVAFLNLHGDAAEHPKQLEFLQAVSTVNVLLLSECPMSESAKEISQRLSKSTIPLICLFSGKDKIQPSKNPRKVRLAAKNKNQAEFSEELVSSIKHCISEYKQTASIERCLEEARKQQFTVDEDRESSQDGHAKAEALMCVLKDMEDKINDNFSTVKETILPLQGNLWHEWCKKNKEQFRLKTTKGVSIQKNQDEIKLKMTQIRETQLEKATPLNDFIHSFLECLACDQFEDTHMYMLQWLRILLDDLTIGQLASLEQDYYSTWKKLKNVPKGKGKAAHENPLQKKLDDIADKMAATTFGIQHIMREISQLYEANHMSKKKELPKIGVTLLISGYPLEIMDGDAAHVPSEWITAVLDELRNTLGDKKVFVLSILGLQSSGKSTLLNTMFGLQFAVSAGRCTRGAFMQLLKVDPSIRNELGYDFVLIVDTEGLRSPELSTKVSLNHDNELATFIIGIGDVTVINIMGENPSDMQDILQICVQAFLRMKRVKITPSCVFVHQNVADSSAGDKNIEGRRRLLEKLDEMAQIAAKEEDIDDITSFSDVIQFDIETQVFHFKNLLEGDPPMAPINPSYSQNVQELKKKLLTVRSWQEKCKFSSLSEFKCRVSDLWSALLQENFVFSFKNTIELMVYNTLEHKYGDWSWKLRKHSLSLQTKLENQIRSSLLEDVPRATLINETDKVYKPLKSEIEKYFTEDKNKDTLIKWKANIELRFTSLKNELIDGIKKKCEELLTAKRNRSELDLKRAKYTEQLTEQSKKLASKLKSQHVTDQKMSEEFDKLWKNWTTEVLDNQPTEQLIMVKPKVEEVLLNVFSKETKIVEKVKHGTFKFDADTHINRSVWKKIKCFFSTGNFDHSVRELQGKCSRAVNDYITDKEHGMEDFDISFIYEMLSDINKNIDDFEKVPDNPKFTNEFRADLSIKLCLENVTRLQKMHEEFRIANQPLTYLQSQRETYFQSFKNYCRGANSVTIFVDFLCKNITHAAQNAANNKTGQQIADLLKCNNPALSGNRSNLENHILKDLATQEKFSLYEEYIFQPKTYFKKFIQEQVNKFCCDDNKLRTLYQENFQCLINQLLISSRAVTTQVSEKKGNASMWLDLFKKEVGGLIVIKREELNSIEKEDITDWAFLEDTMATSLEEMFKDVKMDLKSLREVPTAVLFQQLQGCWAQCPFCNAICTNTIPDHEGEQHSVRFHRSEAVGGRKWHGTDHFAIEFCTTSVVSDDRFRKPETEDEWIPYKEYTTAGEPYSKWSITADGSTQKYWKWFLCHFRSEWEAKFGYKFTGEGEIPPEWEKIKKEDVLKELELSEKKGAQ